MHLLPVLSTQKAYSDSPAALSTPSTQVLVSQCPSLVKTSKVPWGKDQFQDLKQENDKMSLEHLLVPESKEMVQEGRDKARGERRQLEGAPLAKSGIM